MLPQAGLCLFSLIPLSVEPSSQAQGPALWGASRPKSQLVLTEEPAKFGNAKSSPRLAIGILLAFVWRGDAGTYCPLVP